MSKPKNNNKKKTNNTNAGTNLERVSIQELSQEHNLIFTKVTAMLAGGRKQSFILAYLKSKGLIMSKASLTNLKKKMEESQTLDVPLEELLDKRKKNSISDVDDSKITGFNPNLTPRQQTRQSVQKINENAELSNDTNTDNNDKSVSVKVKHRVNSPKEILEEILNKGSDTLTHIAAVDPAISLKAADLYLKYYGKENHGLTTQAIQEYQILTQAIINAMQEVVIEYVPKEKRKEALEKMAEKRQAYLDEFGASDAGQDLLKAYDEANLSY